MTSPSDSTLLSMRNIHISYGTVRALKGVDFDLRRGEVHALVGEHRAGKSSLVKLLSGAERRKQGEIVFEGRSLAHITPRSAAQMGIGIVYQNLSVIPDLNAIDNLFIGQPASRSMVPSHGRARVQVAREIFEKIGFSIDFDVPLCRLPVIAQHMIEFARALLIDPTILILDELSNKLTPDEMKKVYRIIFELRQRGRSVIYISHDVDEVLRLADRVTILKNGYRRETVSVKNLDRFRLFQMTYTFTVNQEKLEYTQNRLALIRGYLENIVQNLPIGIILVDETFQVELVNIAAVGILELRREPLNLRPVQELLRFDPDLNRDILDSMKRRASRSWDEVELGDQKLLQLKLFPLVDGENTFMGSVFVLQDISINRRLDDYLIESEKMATVAEMAVGVAHEINNPLYVIQNYVELIRDHVDGSETQERIGLIEEQLDRIVKVISGLLSFSRLKKFPDRRVNVRRILEDVLVLLEHALAEKRIQIATDFPREEVFVVADENKLKQVFVNLIRNSIEAVLDNGSIALSIATASDGSFAEVAVLDNGSGIPEEVRDKIFNPFFSTKVNKNNTGLGLSICRHIVEEHHGSIAFATEPGSRTAFTVRLPTRVGAEGERR